MKNWKKIRKTDFRLIKNKIPLFGHITGGIAICMGAGVKENYYKERKYAVHRFFRSFIFGQHRRLAICMGVKYE